MTRAALPLILTTPASPAVAVSGSATRAGQPVRRFKKELIRKGKFYKAADDLRFEVDDKILDHWPVVFSQMKANGVAVWVPSGHTNDPDKTRGEVIDVFREGDSLFGIVELVGEGIKLAATNDVSIYAEPSFIDGKGNKYEWPIRHVALCPDPAIPGLAGFQPLEASQGKQPATVPVLKLQEQAPMPDAPPPATKPGDAIREAIKAQVITVMDDDSIDDAAALTQIKELFKARAKALGILEPIDKAASAGETKTEPAPEGGAAPVVASQAPTKDPMVLRMARKSRLQDLDALVTAGKITPAVRAKLAKQWVPEKDDALALSLSSSGCDQFDALVGALADNAAAVPTGERTGPQALVLGGKLPGGEEEAKRRKEAGDELRADVRRRAGLPPAK